MSTALDPTLQGLDACGCCEGTDAQTPAGVANRPGLGAVAYRAGTHATFLASMKAALSAAARPALRGLSARDDDFSVALLDAWATVADVLTFYNERIAAESWLRTATERRSVLELARSIGYELNPGVAAATWLAFTLEDAPGAPERVAVRPGTRVQSVPGPGELPQTFETTAALDARPGWNELVPRPTRPQDLGRGATGAWVRGTATLLEPGDAVLVVGDERLQAPGSERWDFRILREVAPDAAAGRTWLGWEPGLGHGLDGVEKPTVDPGTNPRLYAFRQRASLFGHNAPDYRLMPESARRMFEGLEPRDTPTARQWPGFEVAVTDDNEIDLDQPYPQLLPDSWMVLSRAGYQELYRIVRVREGARADFALSGKTARVQLDAREHLSWFGLRNTVAFIRSEELALAEEPIPEPVMGDRVELDRGILPLEPGRVVLVRGRRARVRLAAAAELHPATGTGTVPLSPGESLLLMAAPVPAPAATGSFHLRVRTAHGDEGTAAVPAGGWSYLPAAEEDEVAAEAAEVFETRTGDPEHTLVLLTRPLAGAFDRADARLPANVAPATHGEAVAERLGSGDGTREWQRFVLRQAPLTHVPDPSPRGGASTLEVRVGELAWTEVPTLHGRGPRDRVYTTRRQDDGATVVQFGDGRTGARLPTGRENVGAAYRKGIGRVGNVRAGQLSLLMTRELGLRSVGNPLPASGGTDPQEIEQARENAPLTVLTLDRIVSLRDYRDFARSFTGVAKAHAVWVWDGDRRGVLLTVAGPGGDAVPAGGPVQTGLLAAAASSGDAHVPVRVLSYVPLRFRLAATVRREPEHLAEAVLAAVEAALRERFSFAARGFGQRVALSEVAAAIQDVPGVRSVDVDLLYVGEASGFSSSLDAPVPRPGTRADAAAPAALLVLELRPGDVAVRD
jgi:hypothetical protein